jgi:pyrroloquinoline quinone biosynthesis protein D
VKLRFDETRGRWIVLAPERLFEPDDIAVEILRRIDGARPAEAIVDELADLYSAPRAEIAADVAELLADLAARGVVAL